MAALETGFFDDQIESHLKESFYVNNNAWKNIIKLVKKESLLEQTYAEFKILAQSPKSSPDYIVQTMGPIAQIVPVGITKLSFALLSKLLKQ